MGLKLWTWVEIKDSGATTKSVIDVCEETEKCFERMPTSTNEKLPQVRGIPDAIATTILSGIDSVNIFKNLHEHMLDTPVNANHTFSLIKTISHCYSKVCLYHLGKEATEKLDRNKVRKKLNKLVLFKHQWNFAQHF